MLLVVGCDDASEAVRVERPVTVTPLSAADAVVTNDLGYSVAVTELRAAFSDLVMSRDGEEQLSLWDDFKGIFVSRARAHPGHSSGGEITGELLGDFVADWSPTAAGQTLGTATLLTGDYDAFSFRLRQGAAGEGAAGDLEGLAFVVAGTASKDGKTTQFRVLVQPTETPTLAGAVFKATVAQSDQGALELRVLLTEPTTGATVFDGLDFASLDEDGDGSVVAAAPDEAHNRLARALHSHDFYILTHNTMLETGNR